MEQNNAMQIDKRFPLVSVIIPVYNVEDFHEECVKSVTNQTYTNLEIILSDDGSIDSSGAIADRLAASDGRIRVIHEENGGPSAARNSGLDIATGKYVLFVDGDDTIHSSTIERLVEIAELNDTPLVMTPEPSLSEKPMWKEEMPSDITTIEDRESLLRLFLRRKAARSSCCNLFKREVIGDLRFELGVTGEDTLFMADFIPLIDSAIFTNNDYYFYRINHKGLSHSFTDRKFDLYANAIKIDQKMAKLPFNLTNERRYFIITCCVDYCMQVIKHKVMRNYRKEYVTVRSQLRKDFWRNLFAIKLSNRYKMKMILAVIK